MHSLDLMETYHFLHVNSPPPKETFELYDSFHQFLGVSIKGCTEAVCLYSSQCECLSGDTVLLSCKGTGVQCEPPPLFLQSSYSFSLFEPSA